MNVEASGRQGADDADLEWFPLDGIEEAQHAFTSRAGSLQHVVPIDLRHPARHDDSPSVPSVSARSTRDISYLTPTLCPSGRRTKCCGSKLSSHRRIALWTWRRTTQADASPTHRLPASFVSGQGLRGAKRPCHFASQNDECEIDHALRMRTTMKAGSRKPATDTDGREGHGRRNGT